MPLRNFVHSVCKTNRVNSMNMSRSKKSKFLLITFIFKTFFLSFFWRDSPPQWAMASSFTRFPDHTQRRTTVGRTPLDEWSARRGDLYLTTHNTHNRQTSMPPVGFEPTISAGERPQTYALDRAATGTGILKHWTIKMSTNSLSLLWHTILRTLYNII